MWGRVAIDSKRKVFHAALIAMTCSATLAAPPTARDKQLITEAMLGNFDACNREDIDDTMASCAEAMPEREKFREETLATFEEKDIHYSLVECEVLEVKPPWAKARIVQKTHLLDRDSKNQDQAAYRNSSALLPGAECVEYINTFRKEKGKWKLHVIISPMRQVDLTQRDPVE